MVKQFTKDALDYHALPIPGKISVELTKPADTMRHLAMAYSPGVAEPCNLIAQEHSSLTAIPVRVIALL